MSATGLREQRAARTAAQLTVRARRWTAERGLAGFTVDELCRDAMVSRRSFFNYFATKEDAVLGVRVGDHEPNQGELGPPGPLGRSGLSSNLVDDLADLLVSRYERLGLAPSELQSLIAAIDCEPRLLARARQLSRLQEREDIALVERRESLSAGDARAGMLVSMLDIVLRSAMREAVSGDGEDSLRAIFARRLATARLVFAD